MAATLAGQKVEIRDASPLYLPAQVDSNSPAFWIDGRLHVLSSVGYVTRSSGWSQLELDEVAYVEVNSEHQPVWIEAAWQDPQDPNLILAWYHYEPGRVCPNSELSFPRIGALISQDGGLTFADLGLVLESGEAPNCSAGNGFFAGGHGDFSVIHDAVSGYFYFLFGNYGGPVESQGVAVARMAFEDRYEPAGRVFKFHSGTWDQPGLGGLVTPIFPVRTGWETDKADAYWGPSIHFNTAINSWVVLLNHTCCGTRWPQEGIYVSFSKDLSDPASWSAPKRILDTSTIDQSPAFYPQVLGVQHGETDTLASRVARLYVQGVSKWELVFSP